MDYFHIVGFREVAISIAFELARYVSSHRSAPPGPQAQARKALFDLVIAAIAGHQASSSIVARSAAQAIWGAGVAPVWFSGQNLTVAGAAFANSAASSALDLDDGHRAAAGHPGASILPAVLAAAAGTSASAESLMTAVVIGYEVAVRIAAARDFASLTTMVSGPWVGQGAAAAVAWLRGADEEQIAQAIALAGASAPNLNAVGYSKVMGNHLKEGIPWATATGVSAAELAMCGYTGPTDLLDNDALFDRSRLLTNLGTNWAIEGIYFKPYSCCRWAHSAIDAILRVREDAQAALMSADRVTVETFGWADRLNNDRAPKTLESAQYSVPFCVALAAIRGEEAVSLMTEESLRDQDVLGFSARVETVVDAEFDRMFPKSVPARVVVRTGGNLIEETVLAPLGEPANPLDWPALSNKLGRVTKEALSEQEQAAFLGAGRSLEAGDLDPMLHLLERQFSAAPRRTDRSRASAGIGPHRRVIDTRASPRLRTTVADDRR